MTTIISVNENREIESFNQTIFDKNFKLITKENVDFLAKVWDYNDFEKDSNYSVNDIIGRYMDIYYIEDTNLTTSEIKMIQDIKNPKIENVENVKVALLYGQQDYINDEDLKSYLEDYCPEFVDFI